MHPSAEVVRKVKKLSAASTDAWLKFIMNWSHGGEQMVVRYRTTGEIVCSTHLDGLWHRIDVSEYSAATRLKNLATAATPRNSVNGEYGLHSPTCIRVVRAPSTLKIRESECGCSSAVTIGAIADRVPGKRRAQWGQDVGHDAGGSCGVLGGR